MASADSTVQLDVQPVEPKETNAFQTKGVLRMRLYIIGPVSGHENDNIDAFEEARDRLKAAGHKATIPHEKIPAGTPWRQAMRMSIRELLSLWKGEPRYEGVAELPGVFGSKGARCERGICEQLGIPHKPVDEWING